MWEGAIRELGANEQLNPFNLTPRASAAFSPSHQPTLPPLSLPQIYSSFCSSQRFSLYLYFSLLLLFYRPRVRTQWVNFKGMTHNRPHQLPSGVSCFSLSRIFFPCFLQTLCDVQNVFSSFFFRETQEERNSVQMEQRQRLITPVPERDTRSRTHTDTLFLRYEAKQVK